MNKKLVKEREAIEASKKKLEEAKAELTVEQDKVKKLDDEIKEHQEKIKKLEEDVKKANENVNKKFAAAEAKKMLDLDLPGFDSLEDMIPYNINNSNVTCHKEEHRRENVHNLLRNDCNYQWLAREVAEEGQAGWVHIKFRKPLIMNGFGLTSNNESEKKDPKNFRMYAKIIHHEGELKKLNEYPFKKIEDFDLIKIVKDEKFQKRGQNKRYAFDNGGKHMIVSEIKLFIDNVQGAKEDGLGLLEIQALF